MCTPPLCAHLCHLLRGQTRMITPGRTPTTWLPKNSPGLVNREAAPVHLVYAASPWDREDHRDPAVFLSRDTASILARAMLYLTSGTVPH